MPHPICFDATGTLIELNESVGEVYRRVALEHGIDLPAWRLDDASRRVLRRAPVRGVDGDTVAARRQCEVDWWFERIRETFQATDSTARFDDFPDFATALFDAYRRVDVWRLRTGASEMLTTLRDRGWPLAVISNFDHRLPKIMEDLDISTFFDIVVIPSESGSAKPERAVFEVVGEALKTPVESLLYVGDDATEVLDAIAGHGLSVFDVRKIGDLVAIPDLVSTTATLLAR
jgi:putative hydrolase of the HAD superfamily